jgi:hypothetical protein
VGSYAAVPCKTARASRTSCAATGSHDALAGAREAPSHRDSVLAIYANYHAATQRTNDAGGFWTSCGNEDPRLASPESHCRGVLGRPMRRFSVPAMTRRKLVGHRLPLQ